MKNLSADTMKMIKTFGVIVGAMVVILLFILIIGSITGNKVNNNQLVNVVENAAKKYFNANTDKLPTSEGESVKVTTDTLVEAKYMKPFEKITKNDNCSGDVRVTNNGGEYLYNTSVKCDQFKTTTLGEELEKTIVSSGDGLYVDGTTYYYRGEYVNNYIKLGDKLYRIISMKDGLVKVADAKLDLEIQVWDDRYNVEKGQDNLGVNDFEKSRLREYLDSTYTNMDESVKKYIVNSDWCIGKRDSNDNSITSNECSVLTRMYIGTITPNEYIKASLDSNCDNIRNGACKNYNYLTTVLSSSVWTSTAVSNTSYEAFGISEGIITVRKTFASARIMLMFNINSNNIYVSGDGTETNPYIIK